jgi:hypothetical protein
MMIHFKDEKQITYFIVACFIASAFFPLLGFGLFPPDFEKEFPVYHPLSIMMNDFGAAWFLAGLTVLGLRLAEERKTMPAAGFTMLAISVGVMMASMFEITQINSEETYVKFYYIGAASNFLYLPSMLLISFYDGFKRWVRFIGLLSSLPLLATTLIFLSGYRDFVVMENIANMGYFMMFMTQLTWAYNIYSNYRRKTSSQTETMVKRTT